MKPVGRSGPFSATANRHCFQTIRRSSRLTPTASTRAGLANCNWLQGNEGNVDPSHTSYLHRFVLDDDSERARLGVFAVDTAPELTVEDTRFGVRLYADRSDPRTGDHILRITNGIMPNACAISGYEAQLGPGGLSMFWHVPIDDTAHWRYEFTFHAKKPLPRERMAAEYAAEKIAGTDVPRRNAANGFLQDRDAMDRSFLGMGKVFPVHDLFVTESQGTLLDHAEEHLSATDVGIARLRKHLLEACARHGSRSRSARRHPRSGGQSLRRHRRRDDKRSRQAATSARCASNSPNPDSMR